eukprot:1156484-Pelagomonas_calceolata.AAC.11
MGMVLLPSLQVKVGPAYSAACEGSTPRGRAAADPAAATSNRATRPQGAAAKEGRSMLSLAQIARDHKTSTMLNVVSSKILCFVRGSDGGDNCFPEQP